MAQPLPLTTKVLVPSEDLPGYYAFLQKFGFHPIELAADAVPTKYTEFFRVTDGQILLTLMKSDIKGIHLAMFTPKIDELAKRLQWTSGVNIFRNDDTTINEIDIVAPGNMMIYIHPTAQFNLHELADSALNPRCGALFEYSIAVPNLDSAIEFWKVFGFTVQQKNEGPVPSAIIGDHGFTIGLHQDPKFDGPALSYAANDSKAKIAAIRKAGIEPIVTLENKDKETVNASFQAPEGLVINIYHVRPK